MRRSTKSYTSSAALERGMARLEEAAEAAEAVEAVEAAKAVETRPRGLI